MIDARALAIDMCQCMTEIRINMPLKTFAAYLAETPHDAFLPSGMLSKTMGVSMFTYTRSTT